METSAKDLLDFLNSAHSAYHAASAIADKLQSAGFVRLHENGLWQLSPGGKYYLTRGGTAVIAFRVPEGEMTGFLMSAAHTDRPTFKVKENAELTASYNRLAVERYGGQILSTWLDRPLSVAGRVMVETPEGAESRLVDIDKDLLLIPNVAIHMNRAVNDGYKWNPAVDTIPLLGSDETAGAFTELLERTAGGKVLGHDLTLYVRQKANIWGIADEYIGGQALDDLAALHGCLQGFLKANMSEHSCAVFAALDSEEVGSSSVQGAASTLLRDVCERIARSLGLSLRCLLANSFLISADNGHALHPNHPELADPTNAPILGGGVLLKFNAALKYCTDGLGAALWRTVCRKAGVRVQTYCNRADIPGGSTLGCISLSQVSVPTVDVGLPQLSMHSAFESCAVRDCMDLEKAMACYYESSLSMDESGFALG